ncbi:Outer membrane protein beta-barrel domain-containing protein [Abditibacterium utsteinense]|uniref:Outer membrane protein beta-barrel domain-containing protein n=1 Tax=Abditibacterium utsteinense TaxID=1960156 RepID=A0A2S8SUF5_9BACT|nr:outer membrane beta-barrel protein [Abditibacterium utsteinense]PQV64416.1 Outer membrane protein beta-barrel domain-containing protein [Abditibacterium utsteinense]
MNFRLLFAPLLGAFIFCGFDAHAQSAPRIGIDGGVFFPSSSKTKSVFGSNFKSFGPGFGSAQVLERKIYPDFDFLREKRGDNRATILFAGAKILIPLGRAPLSGQLAGFAPYSGAGVNLTYADIDAPDAGVKDKGFGAGASAILGASFGQRFFVESRYRLTSSAANFNFSGAQLVVGARF